MEDCSIVFDLDGTLVDSAPDVCRALNRTLATINRPPHSVDEITGYLGHGAHVLMEMALAHTGDIPDSRTVQSLTRMFLEDYARNPVVESTVYPGVLGTLDHLRAQGASLSICTNKPSVTAVPVLSALGLDHQFDAVVCGDQVKIKKPGGTHIIDTLNAAGGRRNRAVMVGDSENDIAAAIDAGIPSVLVTFGYARAPHKTLGADVLVHRFEDIRRAAHRLFRTGCT